ncbi:MAG: retropepsin-like aspartic protease [Paenibacillaceae bacterium]
MIKLNDDGQLLTATIAVCYRGNILQIDDMIIDTGSSHTLISPDILEEIGVVYENGDPVYEAYGIGGTVPFYTKVMDYIQLDTLKLESIKVDVGVLPKLHKGLLGLDILKTNGFILDMDKLELYIPQTL